MPEPTAIAWQETPLVLIAGDVDDDPLGHERDDDPEVLEDDEDELDGDDLADARKACP